MRAACLALALMLPALQAAADQEAYYYPPVGSREVFERQLAEVPEAPRTVRIAFITEVTRAQLKDPASPRFAIFAKGAEAEHMIIVALDDQVFSTIYRARAVLAQMSINARETEYFQRTGVASIATWFDLAKALGFHDIVISDGVSWSHLVVLRPEAD